MKVLINNEPILNEVSTDVDIGDDVSVVAAEMKALMSKSGGIGLAANQVGLNKRIIVLKTPNYKGCIVNPVITNHVKTTISSREGCLSFPGKFVDRKRYNKIVVEGFNEKWEPIKVDMKGLSSFCVQHEIDHLNGITIGGSVNASK